MGKLKLCVENRIMQFLWGHSVWVLGWGRNRNRQRKIKEHLRWGQTGDWTQEIGVQVTLEPLFPVWPDRAGSAGKR